MKEVTLINYTFAFAQFLKEHPEQTVHKNSMVFVFESDGEPVETIVRCLN